MVPIFRGTNLYRESLCLHSIAILNPTTLFMCPMVREGVRCCALTVAPYFGVVNEQVGVRTRGLIVCVSGGTSRQAGQAGHWDKGALSALDELRRATKARSPRTDLAHPASLLSFYSSQSSLTHQGLSYAACPVQFNGFRWLHEEKMAQFLEQTFLDKARKDE